MNGHDVAPGNCDYPGGRKKEKKKKCRDEMCVIYVWDRDMLRRSRAAKLTRMKKKILAARRLFDSDQVILSTNFYRNFFDRAIVIRHTTPLATVTCPLNFLNKILDIFGKTLSLFNQKEEIVPH